MLERDVGIISFKYLGSSALWDIPSNLPAIVYLAVIGFPREVD